MSEILLSVRDLVPLLILALIALALLLHRRRRKHKSTVTIDEFSDGLRTLDSLFLGFSTAKRIFDRDDLDFMRRRSSPQVRRQFQHERKALAISWLRQTQQQSAQLMDLHLRLASCTYEPSATFEFRVEMKYLSFSLICHLLIILVWLRGPFHARRIVGYTIGSVDRFCALLSRRLENINPARLLPPEPGSADADA